MVSGQQDVALEVLRVGLAIGAYDAQATLAAGRLIQSCLTSGAIEHSPLRVLVLGQCTTSRLTDALVAVCWGHGIAVVVRDGGYDQVLQDLADIDSVETPDVVVLLPWHQRLLADNGRGTAERVTDEVEFWERAWHLVEQRKVARVVQVGYDWITPGAPGFHLAQRDDGDIGLVRQVNQIIRRTVPTGVHWISLEDVSGTMGRTNFYDPRSNNWTQQPFSEPGLVELAQHLCAAIRALFTGPKKVLVLDLDNTLWGGVVGEVGAQGIKLGDDPEGRAFLGFQRHVKALSASGVLLAVCSKNNLSDAQEPFRVRTETILKLDDFACFVANWESKAENLRHIANALSLNLDSFVFFDDNPAEQTLVRQQLPQVEVVTVPNDPSEFARTLQAGLWFERSDAPTVEDSKRTLLYAATAMHHREQSDSTNMEDYFTSLCMHADVRTLDAADMPRVVQLIAKTNQFNLTTTRHTAAQIEQILAQPGAIGMSLRLTDRFADHGLVAVLIAEPMTGVMTATLRIDTLLLSCRVIGRTVEHFLLNELADRAACQGINKLLGEYRTTSKNFLVSRMYDDFGFERIHSRIEGILQYVRPIEPKLRLTTFVTRVG